MTSTATSALPKRRLELHRDRAIEKVDPALRDCLTHLVSGSARWPLLLHGPPGRGKTCASLLLCDHAITATYQTVSTVCDEIMQGHALQFFPMVTSKAIAILDELGTRDRANDLHLEAITRFADVRERRPTVFVSNLTPTELGNLYGDRVFSRIASGTWFHLTGHDRRLA